VIGAAGYAEIITELLEEFDGPAVLIGHSFGGRVAVCLAAARPDLVDGLVLTGTPLVRLSPRRRPPVAYRIIKQLNKWGVVGDDRLEQEKRKRGSADYRAASGIMRDVLVTVVNESYEAELKAISTPTALLWGKEDGEVGLDVARQALRIRESAALPTTLEVLEGVGHHLPTQAPGDLRRVAMATLG
jgi:pimeloyl-ACP methyl ester carboxylesterase